MTGTGERPRHPPAQPYDVDGVGTVATGTILWAVAFVALLPFRGRLEDAGRGWWLWACFAGAALGALGLWYCVRRRNAIRRDRRRAAEEAAALPREPFS